MACYESSTLPWYTKLLGSNLALCSNASQTKPTEIVFEGSENVEVFGLYFTPFVSSSSKLQTTTTTAKLVELYQRVNTNSKKMFEVVQIVTSGNTDREDDQSSVENLTDMPWYTLPLNDMHRKARLTRRYRVKPGVATLVLLDARSGRVITGSGCDRLEQDPEGTRFPWKPRPVTEVLEQGGLIPGGRRGQETVDRNRDAVTGIYFSAHWCPPCKAFTPQLIDTYTRLKARGRQLEIIFVSSDRSAESFQQYLSTMPWLAVPYEQEERRRELAALFGVQGIPTLVLLDAAGHVITEDGRGEVNDDPDGLNFPWRPKLVNILNERYAASLHDHRAIILFIEGDDSEWEFAESVLLPAAEEYNAKCCKDLDEEDRIHFFISCDCETSDLLREFLGIDDAVPLLTAVDIPRGKVSVMEDGAEITEQSVSSFVSKFLDGTLHSVDILVNNMHVGTDSISLI